MRVTLLTDDPKRFHRLAECVLWDASRNERETRRIIAARHHGEAVVIRLAGCETAEAAAALAGKLLAVPRAEALPLPPGRFYPWQLEGCRVVTQEGARRWTGRAHRARADAGRVGGDGRRRDGAAHSRGPRDRDRRRPERRPRGDQPPGGLVGALRDVMRIDVVTLFPGIVEPALTESMIGRARTRGIVDIRVVNLRDYADGRHRVTDDYQFGGGSGMVLKPEPLVAAVTALRTPDARVILMDPRGPVFTQRTAATLAAERHLILLAGRYEGVDERVAAPDRRRAALDRRLRVDGRRAAGPGGDGRGHAALAGCARGRGGGDARVVRERVAGAAAVHAARRVHGGAGARGAAVGRPRADRAMAPPPGAVADMAGAARSPRGGEA